MKVRRVQKYVETLDILKMKNSMANGNGNGNGNQIPMQHQQKHNSNGQRLAPIQEQPLIPIEEEQPRQLPANHHHERQSSTSGAVVVTTQWEIFDSAPGLLPVTSASTSTSTSATNNNNNSVHQPKFPWDFFN